MNPRLVLILAAALFVLSPLAAWLYHSGYIGEQGVTIGGKNNGELIHPARPLETIVLEDLSGNRISRDAFLGLWTLVEIADKSCADDCMKNVYKMRQIRLALGKDAYRVQRMVLSEDFTNLEKIMHDNPGTLFYRLVAESKAMLERFPDYIDGNILPISGRVYIIDPQGNLMMRYPHDMNPSLVLKDLRQLLKATWIRPKTDGTGVKTTATPAANEE